LRFRSLVNSHPEEAERLLALAQESVDRRWKTYEDMASAGAEDFEPDARKAP
jgi:pyruvate-ferredoxin/flavodoxin oxidoreductase